MKNDPDTFHLILSTNDKYKIGTYITIASLVCHLSPTQKTAIHILIGSPSIPLRNGLEKLISLSGKPIEFDFKDPKLGLLTAIRDKQRQNNIIDLPEEAYARLLIPALFPDLDFAVYLDSDFLVQKDFSTLLQLRKESYPLFAVQDVKIKNLSHPHDNLDYQYFNLNPNAPYFNSGFLVMNLDKWERTDFLDNCTRISDNSNFRWFDQSILNVIFAEKWKQLDDSWNTMIAPNNCEYLFPNRFNNYHFVGEIKPWEFPRRFSLGCVEQSHRYLSELTKDLRRYAIPYRQHHLKFFLKSRLKIILHKAKII